MSTPTPNEDKKNETPIVGAQTEPVNASEEIRKEIRAMLGQGVDLSRQPVYSPILRKLADRYKVQYPVAKRAFDQVLKETGQKEPDLPPVTRTVGNVKVSVKHRPKDVTRPPGSQETTEPTQDQADDKIPQTPKEFHVYTEEDKSAAKRLFLGTIKAAYGGLFMVVGKMTETEIKKTEQEYEQLADSYVDVAEAYGVEIPKILTLLGALGNTAMFLGFPIIGAFSEARKKRVEAEKKAKAEQAKSVGRSAAVTTP